MNWKIQLSELNYNSKEKNAVTKVLNSGWITMGENVANFEQNFGKYIGKKNHAVAVSSATAGLHLILMAIGTKPMDEVIIPGLTFVSDANVILQLGAKPVFADSISLEDLNVSEKDILNKITAKTKAIVIVHFAGFPLEISNLKKICKRKGIHLIEDVAHAPGASIKNIKCGNFGDSSFYSFFSNKNIACGEGGMVISKNKKFIEIVRNIRSHGMTSLTLDRHKGRATSYDVNKIGLNYRFDEIRAALGLVQLEKLEAGNNKRSYLSKIYIDLLKESEIILPFTKMDITYKSSHHIFPIILPRKINRSKLMKSLKSKGIQTSIHYPAFHSFTAYKKILKRGELPVCDQITDRELTLPLHPKMRKKDVEFVCMNLLNFLK